MEKIEVNDIKGRERELKQHEKLIIKFLILQF